MHTHGQEKIKTYDTQWKIVEGHQQKNLPKSALEEVRKIYDLAKKENQDAQVIKAAVYMASLQMDTRENSEVSGIADLEKEVSKSQGAPKLILTNLLASTYYAYYQNNQWQIYQRTATSNFKKDDISTWSTDDFHKKISALYLASIANETLLKKTKLAGFDAIIFKGNTRKLRPTLYDLLTQKALQYFSSDERDIKKPAYAFQIDKASALDPAADFIHRKFETKDSSSLEFFALQLYQKLIAFHMNDAQPDALIDIDLQRLQFVRQKSVHPDTDELYYMSVSHLADQYQQTPAAAQAWYLKAAFHDELGNTFKLEGDTTHRLDKVKAARICEKIIGENPQSEGGINAYNLLNSIKNKDLQFTAEQVNIPDKPFLVFVESRNVTGLFLRIVKATDEIKKSIDKNDIQETFKILGKAQPLRTWQQKLPETKDFQQHAVQIKVDALPIGEYILIASSNAGFPDSKSVMGFKLLYVSNISYVQRENDFFVLHRDTGQPLAGANVTTWNVKYDFKLKDYIDQDGGSYITDKNGHLKAKGKTAQLESENQRVEIKHGNDRLFIREETYAFYNYQTGSEQDSSRSDIFLFADRSLYRPGQTVYYKGITTKGKATRQASERQIKLELKNANGEVVGKDTKKINDFGSFSGTFVLPVGTLNGQFSIVADRNHIITFNVEEYKRPRFAVEFDTLRDSYKLGDTIKVLGAGNAYAGNAIDGAKVVYRVVRNQRYLYPWLYKSRYFPTSSPQEIAHGETITDASGKFHINFEAIPNLKQDKKADPVFDFTVYADVTDLNGETRSAQTTISVGYKSIILKAEIPESFVLDSLKSLKVRTENMNGQFVSAPVTVRIVQLTPEKRLIKPRYWQRPDLFVMTKEEFVAAFPHDEYDNETEKESWAETGIVAEKTAQVSENQPFMLDRKNLEAGFYKIEITTKDESNAGIRDVRFTEIIDNKQGKLPYPQYISASGSETVEPGEKTSIKLVTSADNLFMISSKGKELNPQDLSFFELNAAQKTFDITAREEDRGGFGIDYMFVKHNRVHQYQDYVNVPWTNKDLKIEYQTFRDKTLPGSKEKWTVKISGYKQDKVAAEMLAGMYDASLDQFYPHQWSKPNFWPVSTGITRWANGLSFIQKDAEVLDLTFNAYKSFDKRYDELIVTNTAGDQLLEGLSGGGGRRNVRSRVMRMQPGMNVQMKMDSESPEEIKESVVAEPVPIGQDAAALNEVVKVGYGVKKSSLDKKETSPAPPRKNFNETAFFFPDLKTDKDGSVTFSFTMPEALTRWKFQALAHTKELAFGYSSKEIITQKELMVQPNPPRFLREGDQISFAAKVVNLSDKALTGKVTLQLLDTESHASVNALFENAGNAKEFTVAVGQSTVAQFAIRIPKNYSKTITWRIIATSRNLSDGEENVLPVLSNRMLVTETLPLAMRGTDSKQFKMEKLIDSGKSKTLVNQSLTVEYTSNPAWYAVQALPYLMEYPYECAEQTWNRYYANAMAANIVASSSKVAGVFETWRKSDTTALLSNLQKNQELKALLLEETPWVLASKTETEQKKNIALLFDLLRMTNELSSNIEKLTQLQNPDGSFSWFKGGPDNRYMTQYILSGIGHLRKADAVQKSQESELAAIIEAAIPYLDEWIMKDYDDLIKHKAEYKPLTLTSQYLYMRSFFPEQPITSACQKAYNYFMERSKLTWSGETKYMQALIAIALHRSGDKATSAAILKSLKQTAIVNEELGMYWKNNQRSWWWHEAPIERQALLIEAFQEIANDAEAVNDLKTWLLKNKQTNNWESTKATAEACYALLMTGTDWLANDRTVSISLGDVKIEPEKAEAGTGYFKKTIEGSKMNAGMGNIEVQVNADKSIAKAPSWGAVYWQYFEDLDKITFSETPLELSKKLFIEKNSDKGPVLAPVNAGDMLHVGDKVKVRIELRADRDMEYVHMKDMRASGFEPVNVLSSYKWQAGLGYYESTKDASTNFFFNTLPKGTYVFEYPLFINQEGDFSNGITTIQCMYAPEFTAHSEGVRVRVGK